MEELKDEKKGEGRKGGGTEFLRQKEEQERKGKEAGA